MTLPNWASGRILIVRSLGLLFVRMSRLHSTQVKTIPLGIYSPVCNVPRDGFRTTRDATNCSWSKRVSKKLENRAERSRTTCQALYIGFYIRLPHTYKQKRRGHTEFVCAVCHVSRIYYPLYIILR